MAETTAGPLGLVGWLRIIARVLALTGLLLICLVLYALATPFGRRNPMPRAFLSGVLHIIGVRLTVTGPPARGPSILLANHLSWIDIPALGSATGTAFVAHDGLAANPALRFLCRLHRTVFIARNDRTSVSGQVDQVRDGLDESGVLTLFPEGTTGDGPQLLPFKSSLLAAIERSTDDVAIRPVFIDFGTLTSQIAWVGDEPGLENAKRILARTGHFDVTVHLLAPLHGEQRRDRKAIAAAAQAAVAARMDQRVAL